MAKKLPPKEDRSALLSTAILMASLYGSGKRDATGYTMRAEFSARRDGVRIEYLEQSGDCFVGGSVTIVDSKGLVLSAKRATDGETISAGYGPMPLSYRIETWESGRVEAALRAFCKGLEPIGRPGDTLRVRDSHTKLIRPTHGG